MSQQTDWEWGEEEEPECLMEVEGRGEEDLEGIIGFGLRSAWVSGSVLGVKESFHQCLKRVVEFGFKKMCPSIA